MRHKYIYGLHDPGGEHIMLGEGVPGWVLITVAIGHDPNDHSPGDDRAFRGDYRRFSDQGLNVIVRLNNGYGGAGTIPYERYYDDFAQRCANFVRISHGAHIWIIGNEPNHPIEWPGADWDWEAIPPRPKSPDKEGEKITPERYARCYLKAREAIHALSGHEDDQVLIAAIAPWNPLTTYPGNPHGDWVQYFRDLLKLLGPENCDGITLHTYTHGTEFIHSEEKIRDPRFQQYHWHFRAYRDFMQAIPDDMRHLPVYITETDQGDDPWRNENTGWVRQAYGEIAEWNKNQPQQIRSLVLYRWPRWDKWHIEGKEGVIEDFKQALRERYQWGVEVVEDLEELRKQVAKLEARLNELQPDIQRSAEIAAQLNDLQRTVEDLISKAEQAETLRASVNRLLSEVEHLEAELGITPGVVVSPPPMRDVRATLPVHASKRYPTRSTDEIRRIIVHHTVTRPDITPEHIARVHVNRGKAGITYHFLINGDGTIHWTQPLEAVTEQTLVGEVNADGVGVALAGNFTQKVPTEAQLESAAQLIAWLLSTLRLGTGAVFGRCELDRRVSSPGAQWLQGARFKDTLLARVQDILEAIEGEEAKLVAQLRQQVRELQAKVAQLQALAEQVQPLQQQVQELQETVTQQRKEIARLEALCRGVVQKPEVIDVVDALPKHPTLRYGKRTRPITTIVIHHTDTPKTHTVEQIAHYHVYGKRKDEHGNWIKREWPGIGYHYVIAPDGVIYQCQRHETRSYHAGGEANNYGLGISLIGRFLKVNYDGKPLPPEDQLPTPEQLRSTSRLVAWLMQELEISSLDQVVGHKEVSITSCPGDQWTAGANWKNLLHQQIRAVLEGRDKPIEHYLLFWDHGTQWAELDWRNAQDYIAHFRPTTGFSTEDAMHARHVTIVGGEAGVSGEEEARLRAAGVDVHRLPGANEAETKAMLDELVEKNTPWPGAPPLERRAAELIARAAAERPAEPALDEWTVPDEWPEPEVEPPAPELVRPRVKVTPFMVPPQT